MTIKRRPSGNPDGGRFAPQVLDEADGVDLHDVDTGGVEGPVEEDTWKSLGISYPVEARLERSDVTPEHARVALTAGYSPSGNGSNNLDSPLESYLTAPESVRKSSDEIAALGIEPDTAIALANRRWTQSDVASASELGGSTQDMLDAGHPDTVAVAADNMIGPDGWRELRRQSIESGEPLYQVAGRLGEKRQRRLASASAGTKPRVGDMNDLAGVSSDLASLPAEEFVATRQRVANEISSGAPRPYMGGDIGGGFGPGRPVEFRDVNFGTGDLSGVVTADGDVIAQWVDNGRPVGDREEAVLRDSAQLRRDAVAPLVEAKEQVDKVAAACAHPGMERVAAPYGGFRLSCSLCGHSGEYGSR